MPFLELVQKSKQKMEDRALSSTEENNLGMVDITQESLKDNKDLSTKVKSPGRLKLESWLNSCMKIEIEDGRTLIGQFLCTDRDCNIILGSCYEYPPPEENAVEDPRVLGLAMVPGKYIVSISIDDLMTAQNNTPCYGT